MVFTKVHFGAKAGNHLLGSKFAISNLDLKSMKINDQAFGC